MDVQLVAHKLHLPPLPEELNCAPAPPGLGIGQQRSTGMVLEGEMACGGAADERVAHGVVSIV